MPSALVSLCLGQRESTQAAVGRGARWAPVEKRPNLPPLGPPMLPHRCCPSSPERGRFAAETRDTRAPWKQTWHLSTQVRCRQGTAAPGFDKPFEQG